MVHNAFDAVQIVKECPSRIESVALWSGKLLLGCMDGSLRIYQPTSVDGDDPETHLDASGKIHTLRNTLIGFAKKAVTAMDVLQSKNMLISLSDAVAVHSLPEFDAVAYLSKTKGATIYAWDERYSLLAAAKLKRIFLYRFDGNRDFVEVKELSAPDAVKSMAWCGDSLCLGIRREYVILNINNGAIFEVFPCGRIAAPLVVSLPNGELLLGKDNIGVFVDHNGKVTQQGAISWSEAPAAVVINLPYAVARLVRFIEVRSLREPFGLVQMVPLRDIRMLLSTDEGVMAVSESSVFILQAVSIGVQVVQLAASGNFDDALALCKLLPPEDAALRSAKEDAIHIRYGEFLFSQGMYADALQHFGVSSSPLRAIVAMFPSITLPHAASNSMEDNISSESVNGQTDFSLNQATSEQLDETTLPDQEEKSKMDAKQRAIAFSALASFLMARRGAVVEKAEAEDTDAAVAAMVEVVQAKRGFNSKKPKSAEKINDSTAKSHHSREHACLLDTALVQAFLLTDQSVSAMQLIKGPNYCDVTACKDTMMKGGHFAELIELYKYNGLHREALQLLNCLVGDSETLEASSHQNEHFGFEALIAYLKPLGNEDPELILDHLIWLLKNHPEQAITLLASMDHPISPSLVISHLKEHASSLQSMYLEQMLEHDAKSLSSELQNELVQLYLSRVLEEHSELDALGKWEERQHTDTRKKLLSALDSDIFYNAEIVLRRLPTNGLYEERALLLGRIKQHKLALTLYAHKLHEPELALDYCDRICNVTTTSGSINKDLTWSAHSTLQNSSDQANIYLTLLEVYLKPQAAIREFDRSIASFAVARNTTNQKVSSAHKVKGHVAKKIAQIEGADDMRHNFSSTDSAADSARSDNDETPEVTTFAKEVMLKEALQLLTCRWDHVDGALALRTLPPDTKLQDLLPFLEPLLRQSSESHRNASVIKSLRRAENMQVREELSQCRKRVVRMTSDRSCYICHKKIGTSVFAVYPNGTLVHFVCYRDQNAKLILSTAT